MGAKWNCWLHQFKVDLTMTHSVQGASGAQVYSCGQTLKISHSKEDQSQTQTLPERLFERIKSRRFQRLPLVVWPDHICSCLVENKCRWAHSAHWWISSLKAGWFRFKSQFTPVTVTLNGWLMLELLFKKKRYGVCEAELDMISRLLGSISADRY